ncbi:MAG: hypothetical protein WCO60_10065 [Verrucomicrobiota bacterium]
MLTAIITRAWLLFSTPLVPGINGAYYLVQTRSLLEKSTLGIPDLPLTFLIQSGVAKLILCLSNLPSDQAILYAVKFSDAILPAFLALPVFGLIRQWSDKNRPLTLPWILALACVLGGTTLGMTGEFQKNSIGLVWLVSLLWSLNRWLDHPDSKNASVVILFMGLGSITHIGVFGTMCLLFSVTLLVNLLKKQTSRQQTARLALGVLLICALTLTAVLLKFDPARVHRLANAFAHPLSFLQSQKIPQVAASTGAPQLQMGPPPGMGPRDASMFYFLPNVILGILAISPIVILWRKRHLISKLTQITVLSGALTLAILIGPWVKGDKMMRFQLMAIPLAIVLTGFSSGHLNRRWITGALVVPLLAGLWVPSYSLIRNGGTPNISEADFTELQSVAGKIQSPETSLVVARHGLEWWAAWTLHTKIAQPTAIQPTDWERYTSIYYLKQTSPFRPPAMGGFAMLRNMPPPGFPLAQNTPTIHARPEGIPPGGSAPPTHRPGLPTQMGGERPMPLGPMSGPTIPDDAVILHSGASFTVAHILNAPVEGSAPRSTAHP